MKLLRALLNSSALALPLALSTGAAAKNAVYLLTQSVTELDNLADGTVDQTIV